MKKRKPSSDSSVRYTIVPTREFNKKFKKLPEDIKKQVVDRITSIKDGKCGVARIHRLKDFDPPKFKIDVASNHSWQMLASVQGTTLTLLNIGTHKAMDRDGKK